MATPPRSGPEPVAVPRTLATSATRLSAAARSSVSYSSSARNFRETKLAVLTDYFAFAIDNRQHLGPGPLHRH
jgi:hypothetical protein